MADEFRLAPAARDDIFAIGLTGGERR